MSISLTDFRNTTVANDASRGTIVTLHNTQIVVFDGSMIQLDTGGLKTKTTKNRMNQTSDLFDLGFSVYQEKKEWFVDFKGDTIPFEEDTLTLIR